MPDRHRFERSCAASHADPSGPPSLRGRTAAGPPRGPVAGHRPAVPPDPWVGTDDPMGRDNGARQGRAILGTIRREEGGAIMPGTEQPGSPEHGPPSTGDAAAPLAGEASAPTRAVAPGDIADLGDAATIADHLHSAAIHLLRRLRAEDAASGLTAPRLSALSVVVYGGPLTLRALADAEQVQPPTMTRLVRALEGAGLVTRRPDPDDGRQILIEATPAGRRLLDAGRARRTATLARRLSALSADERAILTRAVDVLERLARPST